MKNIVRAGLYILIGLVSVIAVGVLVMYLGHICPPQGPWPTPPWCAHAGESKAENGNQPVAVKSTAEDSPTQSPIPDLDYSILVSVPFWTEGDIYLGLDGQPAYSKLEPINSTLYHGTVSLPQDAEYYYSLGTEEQRSRSTYRADFPESYDAVVNWVSTPNPIEDYSLQKGITLGGSHWREDEYHNLDWALDMAEDYGVSHLLLIPTGYLYPDGQGHELKFVYFGDPLFTSDPRFTTAEWGYWGQSLSDDIIREIAGKARSKGFALVFKPHIDVWDGTSRGAIVPNAPELFFENYTAYITHQAALAEELDAELFVIGTELDDLAHTGGRLANRGVDVTGYWLEIIQRVREVYSGPITYSVSCFDICGGPAQIGFWNKLDYIGFEPYFAVTEKTDPTIEELKAGFIEKFNRWALPLAEQYGKDILLTEVNSYAFDGVNTDPIAMFTNPEDHPVDKLEQADYYEGLFQALLELPEIKGTYPWPFWLYMGEATDYDRIQAEKSGRRDNLTGVPAGQVLKKWYLGFAP